MRRGVGISSLERTSATTASYNTLSDSLSAASLATLQQEVTIFQRTLQTFAGKHGSKIKSDPEFRGAFSAMCQELGVDPLAGGKRGIWDWVGFGHWSIALAVQLVDVCLATRIRNGGLHEINDLIRAVSSLRDIPITKQQQQQHAPSKTDTPRPNTASFSDLLNTTITEQDIVRAIKSLEPLGSGYSVITIGAKRFVRSVPTELDNDSLVIFDSILSGTHQYTSEQLLQSSLNWSPDRAKHALDKAVMVDAMLWRDDQAIHHGTTTTTHHFYAPVLFEFLDNPLPSPSPGGPTI
ncbi:hypothetical protein PCANC_27998 [Puccinia coronata f. sp. avenae]|uniref:Vacuolar-sorting protein SNF8 n=1 Tax=Puccinia coronata f. sp. avenae TaxID=200324 RepID=A0A2N5RVE9_9BASI|nr:hypothetical protein PCANC_27998 [Puccinia coronata f. sp. avenae]